MMKKSLYINQTIRIYQSHKSCPDEIINNIGKEAIIKGFKKINNNSMMPIVEFNDQKRMWVFYEEIHQFQ